MTTAYQTGPGMHSAASRESDPSIPPGVLRVHCVRLEAYDLPTKPEKHDLDTQFTLIFAKAEGNPSIARALLNLGKAITANEALLKQCAE